MELQTWLPLDWLRLLEPGWSGSRRGKALWGDHAESGAVRQESKATDWHWICVI